MKYLSVCSGIEAASVAWHPLGFHPLGVSEIEPFPSAVLAHRWPGVPNLGDMTLHHDWTDRLSGRPDILVGGTPCQAFSVAGLRRGLADPRGNLTLVFLALIEQLAPRWVLWENVPGVLSDQTGAFGSLLGGLAKLGYGWAYRVLDAQHIGVPQRRRRVFVVGHLGDWRRAAAVLFERHCLCGHSPPRREAGERPAPTLASRPSGGGGLGTDFDTDGGLVTATLRASTGGSDLDHAMGGHLVPEIAGALCKDTFSGGAGGRPDGATQGHFLPVAFDCKAAGKTGFSIGATAGALRGEGMGGGHAAVAFGVPDVAWALQHPDSKGPDSDTKEGHLIPMMEVAPTLDASFGKLQGCSGQDARHGHGHLIPIAFSARERGDDGRGYGRPPQVFGSETVGTLDAMKPHCVAQRLAVRRLTPRECERLQGFPDDYTAIPWRGRPASECPDGPRYKSLGNSMAVVVMQWIGRRLAAVDAWNGGAR